MIMKSCIKQRHGDGEIGGQGEFHDITASHPHRVITYELFIS